MSTRLRSVGLVTALVVLGWWGMRDTLGAPAPEFKDAPAALDQGEGSRTIRYAYDAAGRLVSADYGEDPSDRL